MYISASYLFIKKTIIKYLRMISVVWEDFFILSILYLLYFFFKTKTNYFNLYIRNLWKPRLKPVFLHTITIWILDNIQMFRNHLHKKYTLNVYISILSQPFGALISISYKKKTLSRINIRFIFPSFDFIST